MTLQKLLDKKKFDYVNSNITVENFPIVKVAKNTKYKLFHFDRYISSDDATAEMKKEGYEPATLYHLLDWEDWNDKDLVVALGSVAGILSRDVACLGRYDSERFLYLSWHGYGWHEDYRFLAFATKKLETKSSSSLSLDLDSAIEICKKNGLKVIREY